MLNYNKKETDNIADGFGISKERIDDLFNKMKEIANDVFIKAHIDSVSSSYIVSKASELPKTSEEIFMVGMFTMKLIEILENEIK